MHGVALEELVVLLDLEALRGVFAVLFFFFFGLCGERGEGGKKKREAECREVEVSQAKRFWRSSLFLFDVGGGIDRAFAPCLVAEHFHFHPIRTLLHIKAQSRA